MNTATKVLIVGTVIGLPIALFALAYNGNLGQDRQLSVRLLTAYVGGQLK